MVSKKNFSTETACLEIQTKLSNACDNGDYAALALLDLPQLLMLLIEKCSKITCKSYFLNLLISLTTG
jgi:hypothetical protein